MTKICGLKQERFSTVFTQHNVFFYSDVHISTTTSHVNRLPCRELYDGCSLSLFETLTNTVFIFGDVFLRQRIFAASDAFLAPSKLLPLVRYFASNSFQKRLLINIGYRKT